ncbi:hypothetical protein F5X96DRAFT_629001 [Biscogniauxia mediterranea]|nr:hypothetical protein F5X96DRAFT_629001 [Biscogniauxia mediterranea]
MAVDGLKLPLKLPSSTHEVIVMLEGIHVPIDQVDTTPRSHELISYHYMAKSHEIRRRGIRVANPPGCTSPAAAEHCLRIRRYLFSPSV